VPSIYQYSQSACTIPGNDEDLDRHARPSHLEDLVFEALSCYQFLLHYRKKSQPKLNFFLMKIRILDLVFNILPTGRRKKRALQNPLVVISFSKQNKNQINSEAELYIRTEEFIGRNTNLCCFLIRF
jgi:hypothetical protein